MELTLTHLSAATEGLVPSAVRVSAPTDEQRIPTHFVALLDISDSMSDSNKLKHVKHCMSLLLKFLTPEDRLSLITFGETSEIKLRCASLDTAHLAAVTDTIQALRTDGCTNLSAGLANVMELLESGAEAAQQQGPQKVGLLVLTDGHANRGVSDPGALRGLVEALHERFPALSLSFVAYGADHNAELLRSCAEATQGAYSIVSDLEGAATSLGEVLGNLISCVAQNVTLSVPVGTVAHGPFKVKQVGDNATIEIGDLYSASKTLLLLDIPAVALATTTAPVVRLTGMLLPALTRFSLESGRGATQLERQIDIDLVRLRYRCSELFRRVREMPGLSAVGQEQLDRDLQSFREALADTAFDGNETATALRLELQSLEAAIRLARSTGVDNHLTSQLAQHSAFCALGRGTSSGITPAPPPQARYSRFRGFGPAAPLAPSAASTGARVHWSQDEDADPGSPVPAPPAAAADPGAAAAYLSPMASTQARRVASLMRASSQEQDES